MPSPWLPRVMGGAAALLLAIAAILLVEQHRFASTAVRSDGIVLPGNPEQPTAEFRDDDGQAHRVRFRVQSTPPAYQAGESVVVMYPRGRPDEARVDSFLERKFAAAVLAFMGTCFGAVAVTLALLFRRR